MVEQSGAISKRKLAEWIESHPKSSRKDLKKLLLKEARELFKDSFPKKKEENVKSSKKEEKKSKKQKKDKKVEKVTTKVEKPVKTPVEKREEVVVGEEKANPESSIGSENESEVE